MDFLETSVVDRLVGKGLDEVFGGKALRSYVTHDLRQYVQKTIAPRRRIILVGDVAQVPWHLQLAAGVLGARVQTQVLTPLLQYEPIPSLTLAFTKSFAHGAQIRGGGGAFDISANRRSRETANNTTSQSTRVFARIGDPDNEGEIDVVSRVCNRCGRGGQGAHSQADQLRQILSGTHAHSGALANH